MRTSMGSGDGAAAELLEAMLTQCDAAGAGQTALLPQGGASPRPCTGAAVRGVRFGPAPPAEKALPEPAALSPLGQVRDTLTAL